MGTSIEYLENEISRPATEAQLVEALLAFAHGSEVAIQQSDEVRRWSLWRDRPSEDERAALVGLLQRTIRKPGSALGVAPGIWRGANAAIEIDNLVASSDYAMPVNEYQLDTCLAHMSKSIERKFVLVPARRGGYSLVDYPRYLNVAAALTAAMLLVADPGKPYAKALCRCKGCDRFYIARRTKKGLLANGVYHDPACRAKYHNSAARKG